MMNRSNIFQPMGKPDIYKLPSGFVCHLAMLAIGTARGVLHAKTENTLFNKYLIPTINVAELIKDDIIFFRGMAKQTNA